MPDSTEPTNLAQSTPEEPTVEPRRIDRGELMEILESGEIGRLLGGIEDTFLEFKQLLDLTQREDKHKLAKSVAGFSNAAGGVLVIGLERGQSPRVRRDFAKSIQPLAFVDVGAYHNILTDWLYPPTRTRIDAVATNGGYVVVLTIEPVGDDLLTLVSRTVHDELSGGAIFGYYRRTEEGTVHFGCPEIHALLTTGLRLREMVDIRDAVAELSSDMKLVRQQIERLAEQEVGTNG